MAKYPNVIAPPPWTLTGNGYIFMYWFKKSWVQQFGHLLGFQEKYACGGLGTVMLVDYHTSSVGPYRELLIVPGRFELGGKRQFSISKIYVSSYDSVWNGINNWGIPKELADFEIKHLSDGAEQLRVSVGGEVFFEVTLTQRKFYLPISTRFFPLRLAQEQNGQLLITNSSATGKATWAKATNLRIYSAFFPDVSQLQPLTILAVKDFEMIFPIPEITNANQLMP